MIDIGTGDGRFVSTAASANPNTFFIGIDANVKPLEKPSMRATRKPAKGGLPNALFVRATVDDLPDEFSGVANEIHIHFPWGSLLKSVAIGDESVLRSLRRISAPECLLEIVIGIDAERDRSEIERLGLPDLTSNYLRSSLLPEYKASGFNCLMHGVLEKSEWRQLETSWAKKLQSGKGRVVTHLVFQAT